MHRLYLIGLLVIISQLCQAQEISRQVVSLGGGNETANEINVSYTLGQVFINTLEGTDMIVTQGFQQPDQKISTNTSFENFEEGSIEIFPIPASEYITIKIAEVYKGDMHIELFASDGSRLLTKVIETRLQNEVNLPLQHIHSGYYLLTITDLENRKRLNQSLIVQK